MNAVLLFDEADALFAKRTEVRDAHDRYANADTNYLLQHIEDFDGIALLASNKRQNIDTAFVRRIRYMLDFPRPPPASGSHLAAARARAGRVRARGGARRALLGRVGNGGASGAQIKLALLAPFSWRVRRASRSAPNTSFAGSTASSRRKGAA